MTLQNYLLIPFFIMLAILLYGEYIKKRELRYVAMTTLVPLIIIYYILGASIENVNWLIVIGLLFGFLGDLILMFDKEDWFVFGLGAFLFGHVFYIIAFLLSIENIAAFPLWGIFLIIPSIVVIIVVLRKTLDKMGELKIPTLAYLFVIAFMGFCTILRAATFEGLSFWLVWLGAQLFIISDGMIAIKVFDEEFSHDEVYIKITYVLAQFFIAQGALLTSLL